MRPRRGGKFSVGDDLRSFDDDGPAISLAVTLATISPENTTLYVRELGHTQAVARITRKDGVVYVERLRETEA